MSAVKSSPPNQPVAKKSWGEAAKAYLDRRAIIMWFLGFVAGIPILLIFRVFHCGYEKQVSTVVW